MILNVFVIVFGLHLIGEDVTESNSAFSGIAVAGFFEIAEEFVVLSHVITAKGHVGISNIRILADVSKESLEHGVGSLQKLVVVE